MHVNKDFSLRSRDALVQSIRLTQKSPHAFLVLNAVVLSDDATLDSLFIPNAFTSSSRISWLVNSERKFTRNSTPLRCLLRCTTNITDTTSSDPSGTSRQSAAFRGIAANISA